MLYVCLVSFHCPRVILIFMLTLGVNRILPAPGCSISFYKACFPLTGSFKNEVSFLMLLLWSMLMFDICKNIFDKLFKSNESSFKAIYILPTREQHCALHDSSPTHGCWVSICVQHLLFLVYKDVLIQSMVECSALWLPHNVICKRLKGRVIKGICIPCHVAPPSPN